MYINYLIRVIFLLSAFSCLSTTVLAEESLYYEDIQASHVSRALKTKSINIIQLGDSHTAADFLTDTVRSHLQAKLGDGGPGWAMPVYFSGMRLARFSYPHQKGWKTYSSRTQPNQDYTLGGLDARPDIGAVLEINTRKPQMEQTVKLNLRQGPFDDDLNIVDADGRYISVGASQKNNQWQFVQFTARFPIKITAGFNMQTTIGGWWAKNQNGQGAIVSALGINGAQLEQWNRWDTLAWQHALNEIAPDLVILAYGTNEAYNNNIDIEAAEHILIKKINQIRNASPHSAIMILGAPESLHNTQSSCGSRPEKLSQFQMIQKEVARTQHTFYWDWQAAMGGECSMTTWIKEGLARKDGVHFTQTGYQKLGEKLAEAILSLQK